MGKDGTLVNVSDLCENDQKEQQLFQTRIAWMPLYVLNVFFAARHSTLSFYVNIVNIGFMEMLLGLPWRISLMLLVSSVTNAARVVHPSVLVPRRITCVIKGAV